MLPISLSSLPCRVACLFVFPPLSCCLSLCLPSPVVCDFFFPPLSCQVRSQGRLKVFARGEKIWDGTKMKEGEPVDIMLVVFGMIRIEIDDGAGNDKSYYLGSGGAYGLIPNITGM